ncbi:hypothetical protein PYCC9005_002983 [Savitreella phatthalungensis]
MGGCLSLCFGSSDDDDNSDSRHGRGRNRPSERTPLLQDPSAILDRPGNGFPSIPNLEEQLREQEALQKIVERVTDNLVDIGTLASLDRRDASATEQQRQEKARQFKLLLNRVLVGPESLHHTDEPGAEAREDRGTSDGEDAQDDDKFVLKPVGEIVVALPGE